jgi:uncharacterized phage protein (TIGR02218 family)
VTYSHSEAAHDDAVELFKFSWRGYFWRFTDSDVPVIRGGETFLPEPVWRSAVRADEEVHSASVEVTLPALNQVSRLFSVTQFQPTNVWLTIHRVHRDEIDGDAALVFAGEVGSAKFEGASAVLSCFPVRDTINRVVPVQLVGRLCNNTLYDFRCRVDPEAHRYECTVTGVSGNVLTVTPINGLVPDGYFDGGYVFSPTYQHTTILTHVGGTLTLFSNPGYLVGSTFSAFAGCDRRMSTCKWKFNNVENHQGYNFFPTIDPFKDGVAE